MTLQAIRAHIETRVNDAFQALVPPIEVVFDNVQETPPALPYVACLISYTDTTVTTVCPTDGAMEQLNGNLQLSIYVPRGRGMKALEQYGASAAGEPKSQRAYLPVSSISSPALEGCRRRISAAFRQNIQSNSP